MTEEIVTQEATAQFGQEAEDITHTVHHGQAPQVLFSIKRSRDWKTRNRNSELGIGSGEGQFISLLFVGGLYGVPLEVSIMSCLRPGVPPRAAHCFGRPVPLPPWSVTVRLPVLAFHDCGSSLDQLCSDTGKPASPLHLAHTFSHSWNRGTGDRGERLWRQRTLHRTPHRGHVIPTGRFCGMNLPHLGEPMCSTPSLFSIFWSLGPVTTSGSPSP